MRSPGGILMTTELSGSVGRGHPGPENTPRLRLKRKAPCSGYVDGAWWPHSDDLTAELPDLIAVLSVRLGPIGRVIYNFSEWAKAPRKFAAEGRMVRLDGYRLQPVSTVEVVGINSKKVVLLVVSPDADPDQAHAMMMTTASPNNALTVASLLTVSADERESAG